MRRACATNLKGPRGSRATLPRHPSAPPRSLAHRPAEERNVNADDMTTAEHLPGARSRAAADVVQLNAAMFAAATDELSKLKGSKQSLPNTYTNVRNILITMARDIMKWGGSLQDPPSALLLTAIVRDEEGVGELCGVGGRACGWTCV